MLIPRRRSGVCAHKTSPMAHLMLRDLRDMRRGETMFTHHRERRTPQREHDYAMPCERHVYTHMS